MERTWTPWLTLVMVAVNVAVFVITMRVNNCPDQYELEYGYYYEDYIECVPAFLGPFSFQPLYQYPLIGPSGYGSYKMGAVSNYYVVYKHQGWRLLTSMWLHAGVLHLIPSMLCLIILGVRLELQFGFVKVGAVYLLSGFSGNVVSCLFLLKGYISVGASGAVCGLAGAMLSDLIINWSVYVYKGAAVFIVVMTMAVNLSLGFLPSALDNFCSLGGFFTGFLLGFVLLIRPQPRWSVGARQPEEARLRFRKYFPYQQAFFLLALLFLVVGFVVSLAMLFKGKNGNDHCNWCHYLSRCIHTSIWECPS